MTMMQQHFKQDTLADALQPPPLPKPIGKAALHPPVAAPSPEPPWPIPVADFLAGPYLRPSDVVLTRKRQSIRSWLIRFATRGSFSHAALVFLVPRLEKGFDNSFVIEAGTSGVELTNLSDYLNDRRQVVGIKRLDKPWFTEELQCLVRGRLLNTIKAPYSYRTMFNVVCDIANELRYGVRSCVFGPYQAICKSRKLALSPPNQYICSGLVQEGFLRAIADLAFSDRISPARLNEVVFRDDLASLLPRDWSQFTQKEQREIVYDYASGFADRLQSVTPNDLAKSSALSWAYVVRDGLVHKIASESHARKLLHWRLRWRGHASRRQSAADHPRG